MLILALDLARQTGFAFGPAGSIPESGTWTLGAPGQNVRTLPPALTERLNALTKNCRPDLIAVEDFMPPVASKSQNATVSQLMLHGGLHAWAGASRIRVVYEGASSIRKHVCGRGHASGDTKAMVISTATLLGLVPKGCTDNNRADACLVWRWACDVVADVRGPFVLVPA